MKPPVILYLGYHKTSQGALCCIISLWVIPLSQYSHCNTLSESTSCILNLGVTKKISNLPILRISGQKLQNTKLLQIEFYWNSIARGRTLSRVHGEMCHLSSFFFFLIVVHCLQMKAILELLYAHRYHHSRVHSVFELFVCKLGTVAVFAVYNLCCLWSLHSRCLLNLILNPDW